MITENLIHKYRPKNFSDIVGQDKAVSTIKAALKTKTLPKGILLTGDSGVGKSSLAFCIARAVNCANYDINAFRICGNCRSCKSSINAYGSFMVRFGFEKFKQEAFVVQLFQQMRFASSHNYQVFLGEEVHLVPKRQQDDLLLRLEDIPPQTLFICATYRSENLSKAFSDRFHTIALEAPSSESITKLLKRICRRELIDISENKLSDIANANWGNPRAAINQLENLIIRTSNKHKKKGAINGGK